MKGQVTYEYYIIADFIDIYGYQAKSDVKLVVNKITETDIIY